jgi:membrane fusion protein (multidrug efflux system)
VKGKTLLLIGLIIVALALVKIFFLTPKKQGGGAPQPAGKQPPVGVNVFVVKNNLVENKLSLSGSILANEEAMLKPETSGKIISLEVKEGTEVQRGQLLARLNDAPLQAQLRKAVVQQKLAAEKEQRLKQLLEVKGVSQDEYDMAATAANAANADVDLFNAQIAETEVRAPFNGVVGLKNTSEGNYISTNDIIASIQQLDPVKIDFSVPEKYALQVKNGDSIYVETNGKRYGAAIYAIDPKIDPNTRSLKVRALCRNPKRELFPGAYAQVILLLHTETSAVIPTMAVIPDIRGEKTFVVRGGKATQVYIETGVRTDSTVEVVKGLKQGDTVVTGGIMSLKPGAPVKLLRTKK